MSRRQRTVGYRWHLRRLMAERGMFATTDLLPLLAERGIALSGVQVYRLVAQTPERLNLKVLVALCDVLGCSPSDLIEPVVEEQQARKAAGGEQGRRAPASARRPRRARIVPEEQ
ncbi:MAG: helix-turn-helix domain-containing protein [Thermoanaerobaculia bacterium]